MAYCHCTLRCIMVYLCTRSSAESEGTKEYSDEPSSERESVLIVTFAHRVGQATTLIGSDGTRLWATPRSYASRR